MTGIDNVLMENDNIVFLSSARRESPTKVISFNATQ